MAVGQRYQSILAAVAIVATATGGVFAEEQSFDAKSEIAALKAEISKLRAESSDSWLNERRTEEVKSLVREVLSDADTRASLAEGGMTAGHNGKSFFLTSEDGSFLMKIAGQIQFRWVWNSRDDSDTDDVDGNETGFVLRRTKLNFSGHIADPKLHYEIQLEVERGDNNVAGDIIVIGYDLTDAITISVGEDKAPFLHEELTSSKRQLAVERSTINELFTLGVVQGIFLDWDIHEMIHLSASVNDGGSSGEPDGDDRVSWYESFSAFDSEATGKDFDDDGTDFAITARIDVLLAGDWKQNKDFTSWPGEELFVRLGGAVHYEVNESGQYSSNDEDNDPLLQWTIDGAVEYQGLSFFAAFVMGHTDFEESGATEYEVWGLVAQIAYNIDIGAGDSLEPFARWEHMDWDGAVTDGGSDFEDETDIVTVGVNWYHKKHDAKFTADLVWLLDASDSSYSGLGILEDGDDGSDDQFVVRLQYQLLF